MVYDNNEYIYGEMKPQASFSAGWNFDRVGFVRMRV